MKQGNRSTLSSQIYILAISALLCAMALAIPVIMPVKVVLEPASFTLASHVPVMLAIFISPLSAVAVSICSGIGFFISTTPIIAMRALSHVVFAFVGAVLLQKKGDLLNKPLSATLFGLLLAVIHAVCEVAVVTVFYFGFGNQVPQGFYDSGFLRSVVLLIGLGTVVHSMVDYGIALVIWKPVSAVITIPVSAKRAPKNGAGHTAS